MYFAFYTEIVCPTVTQPPNANSFVLDEKDGNECFSHSSFSVGAICNLKCDDPYKAVTTKKTTTCTLDTDSDTASWVGDLECEGIYQ